MNQEIHDKLMEIRRKVDFTARLLKRKHIEVVRIEYHDDLNRVGYRSIAAMHAAMKLRRLGCNEKELENFFRTL